jgi:hypothetical protein
MASESASAAPASNVEPLLRAGVGFLIVSLLLTVTLANVRHADTGMAVLSWAANASFWLGIVCVAGDIAARVFRRPSLERRDQP